MKKANYILENYILKKKVVKKLFSHKGHICRIYQLLQNRKKKKKEKTHWKNRQSVLNKRESPTASKHGKLAKTYQLVGCLPTISW